MSEDEFSVPPDTFAGVRLIVNVFRLLDNQTVVMHMARLLTLDDRELASRSSTPVR